MPARAYIRALEDFDAPLPPPGPPVAAGPAAPTEEEWLARIAAARTEALVEGQARGFAEGAAEGRAAAGQDAQARLGDALARLPTLLDAERAAFAEEARAMSRALAEAVHAALRAALPVLAERTGEAEVLRFTEALLPGLAAEPAIALHVAPDHQPMLAARLAHDPRIEVLADAALPQGDARATWRDGEATRRLSDAAAAITDILSSYGLA